MQRDALICRSDYSKDGRGVLVRPARRLAGTGTVFVRFGEKLLVGPPPALKDPPKDLAGWIPEGEAKAFPVGEWERCRVDLAPKPISSVPAPAPAPATKSPSPAVKEA